ncbi:MAG: hypothetical protein HYS02_00200 [Candidatus Staskawiczbacteria bacterium]|nr:hypothetical protein [Candidatus Staskawiczbacteria bacterium]
MEVVVFVAVFSIISLAVISSLFWMNNSNSKTKAARESGENARRALEIITYEIRGAKSVYSPTTTLNQLSLETLRYLPDGENNTFIDFFLCGSAICLKKESQSPVSLTSDGVQVADLQFSQILNGDTASIKISLTVNHSNTSTTLTSTASLRSY